MENILVTGVGGGVGQSVLKSLQDAPYGVVGVDSEELAAGLHAVPRAYKGCYASDPKFVDRLLGICLKEKCRLIFAGHDVELPALSGHAQRFRDQGIIPVVSSAEVVDACDDKLATCAFLEQHGLPAPKSIALLKYTRWEHPVVLKPQHGGARSRDTYVVRNEAELDIRRKLVDPDNCIVQEFIEGEEYTCGSIVFDGHCKGVIVMRRILRDGDTYKAFVEHPSSLEPFLRNLVEALNPFGACNIQLRVRNGEPYVFEINARCSGTTAARALSGFNEPRMIADYLLKGREPEYAIRDISILRYWTELVVPNDRIETLKQEQFLEGDGSRL
jgi:carbamoyl-phosphate synthase large subunit